MSTERSASTAATEHADPPVEDFMDVLRSDHPARDFAKLRTRDVWRGGEASWIVTRYDAAHRILSDRRFTSSTRADGDAEVVDTGLRHSANRLLLFMDPPEHGVLRRSIVRELRSRPSAVVPIVDAGIATLARAPGDLVDRVVLPATVFAVCDVLGLPQPDPVRFGSWATDCSDLLDPRTAVVGRKTGGGALRLTTWVRRAAAHAPADGLLAALIGAVGRGEIAEFEAVSNIVSLVNAGLDTTFGLLGNASVLLAERPGLVDEIRTGPERLGRFLDEVVRLESSVQMTVRTATERVVMPAFTADRGDLVFVLIGCANRDEERFADPDRLDLDRPGPPTNIGFGAGIHRCLGSGIARSYGATVLGRLVDAWDEFEIDPGRCVRRRHAIFRSFAAIPTTPTPDSSDP